MCGSGKLQDIGGGDGNRDGVERKWREGRFLLLTVQLLLMPGGQASKLTQVVQCGQESDGEPEKEVCQRAQT